MESRKASKVQLWVQILALSTSVSILAFLPGCGAGSGVSMTGGTAADEAAILQVLEADDFFLDSVTDTSEDEEGAGAAQAQIYENQVELQSLSVAPGTAELPRFWWRGDLERLGRTVDIHIENGVADVKVVHDIAGTFFIADEVDGVLILWDCY